MSIDDLRRNDMMNHLLTNLEQGNDVGHFGRLVFAMVARHFLSPPELVGLLEKNPGVSREKAAALVQQVQERDYNPPRLERIKEWQEQQEFPICPNLNNPAGCNLYRDLRFPEGIYDNIQLFREKKAKSDPTLFDQQ